jgi:universal stress protein E
MPTIRRVLVAIKDTSAKKPAAVVKAAQLARGLGAQLELFHAIDTPVYVYPLSQPDRNTKQMQKRSHARSLEGLERLADAIRRPGLKVSTAAEWDYPSYEAIIRRAQRIRADLIVAERHPRRHFAPGLLHVADWELLRLSPLPVLLVKSPRPYERPAILAAVDPNHVYAKPAKLDDEILGAGKTIARALRGVLHVMHAYVPMPADMPQGDVALGEDVTAEIERKARDRARAAFESRVRSSAIPAARRHLVEDRPMLAIPETARRTRSSIVVMGAISRSGLKAAFIGNTAERVLDELTCDLFVVKPHGLANRVARARRGARIAPLLPMLA